jgi:hypothetical protein
MEGAKAMSRKAEMVAVWRMDIFKGGNPSSEFTHLEFRALGMG